MSKREAREGAHEMRGSAICGFSQPRETSSLPLMSVASLSRYGSLIGFLGVTFLAAAIGSAATFRSVQTWYPTLVKPSWTPPSAVFGPVWTVLYVAMAIAAWRIWRVQEGDAATAVLRSYGAQLFLNALWSVLFFGMRRPDLALLDIVALWAVLVIFLVRSWRVDLPARAMWSVYVAWVSFAGALNAAVWFLNR